MNFKYAKQFNIDQQPVKKEVIISINKNIISSLGDICQLKGREKTCKTNILVNLIANCLGYTDTLGLDVKKCPDNKHIIYVNTELSAVDFDIKMRTIYSLVGKTEQIPNFTAIHCKGLKKQDTILNIQHQLETLKDVYLLVIDGLVDLCADFNNVKSSEDTIQLLTEWTEQFNCAIITTLHQNPDGSYKDKSRGNLGTYLQQKAESTLISTKRTYKDRTESFALHTQSLRNGGENEIINFKYDTELNHIRSYRKEEKEVFKKEQQDNKENMVNIVQSYFDNKEEYKSKEIKQLLMMSFRIGDTKAQELLTDLLNDNILVKEGGKFGTYKLKTK